MPFQNKPENFQLKMILDNLDMAIALVDRNGDLVYWNDVYVKMLKCTARQFSEQYQNTIHTLNCGNLDYSFSQEVLKTKSRAEGCQKLRDVNGETQYLYATHLPIFDADGEVVYSLGILQYVDKVKERYFRTINKLEETIGGEIFNVTDVEGDIIYRSPKMAKLLHTTKSIAGTDATVLLLGETGVGKDLFARFIHKNSSRAKQKMVCVNCAAIPADLFEAELFGYESGAFTGAARAGKCGLIEDADRGTLFLDEINSMPLAQQSKLLRAIEQKAIQRVGGITSRQVNFRLIAASNVDLLSCVHNNTFRMDLYFRLNVVSLEIPPLRTRPEDIPPLAKQFAAECSERYQRQKYLSSRALEQLQSQLWPGNVRELKNLIERVFLISDPSQIEINNIADYFFQENDDHTALNSERERSPYLIQDLTFEQTIEFYERQILKEALEKYGSPKAVEKYMAMSHATLFRKMNKYQLQRHYR